MPFRNRDRESLHVGSAHRRGAQPEPLRAWLRTAAAAVCIFLVLLVGAAHLLHTHPADAGDQSEANCSLCLVAHLAASPAPVVAGPAIAILLRTIAPPEPVRPAASSSVLAYSIRPPPAL